MAFWERSDSALSDETIRALRDIRIDAPHMLRYVEQSKAFSRSLIRMSTWEGAGTFHRLGKIYQYDNPLTDDFGKSHTHVARFNIHPSPNTCASHLEQWVNNEAIARGFPTPRIVHVDTSRTHCQYPFQIIEYSDGVPLRGQDEETTRKVLAQLGRALRDLHAKPVGDRFGRVGLGTVPEWDMFIMDRFADHQDYCREHNLIDEDQWLEVTIYTATDKILECAEPRLLHADLSYDNILLDAGTKDLKAVIDWEDAVLGDPIFELAGLATFHPEARHSCFLDAYYEGTERPADFEYRFWIYYLRIALAKAVHRHRFGYTDAGGEGRQPADGRIALALVRLKQLT